MCGTCQEATSKDFWKVGPLVSIDIGATLPLGGQVHQELLRPKVSLAPTFSPGHAGFPAAVGSSQEAKNLPFPSYFLSLQPLPDWTNHELLTSVSPRKFSSSVLPKEFAAN